jgi:hypothetical protein
VKSGSNKIEESFRRAREQTTFIAIKTEIVRRLRYAGFLVLLASLFGPP